MKPISDEIPKPLVPIAHRPLLAHTVERLKQAGFDDIGIVISPKSKIPEIISGVTYIVQKEPLGLAHAIKCAKKFIDNDNFIVWLGDIYFEGDVGHFAGAFLYCDFDALILLTKVNDASKYGVVELQESRIVRLIEKPKNMQKGNVCAGLYCFKPCIFHYIEQLKPSERGEYELTDAIQKMIIGAKDVRGEFVDGYWADVGDPKALYRVEKHVKTLIEGTRIYLRDLRMSDVKGAYPRWMNDPAVTRYLESRFAPQTKRSIKEFVKKVLSDENSIFLAIMTQDCKHIGNVKLTLNNIHHTAEIGLIIGEKDFWGKGYATESLNLISKYGKELGLHKLVGGVYSDNLGSCKAFGKAGFKQEGYQAGQYISDGKRVGRVLFGKVL